ncbi:MAG: type VI secretion system tube protein Hcp [Micropepsaceae bacterium]
MASDYLLEIDGVKGETKDGKLTDCIEVDSFSWGASNPTSFGAGGGGGTGKVSMNDVHFTKKTDKASPELFFRCANGEHLTKAVLHVRKAGKQQQEFYTVTLDTLAVSSFQSGGHTGGGITEAFSLGFAKVQFEYKEQNDAGTTLSAVKRGWDVQKNEELV